MKPLNKPKTFEEYRCPTITFQRNLVKRILDASAEMDRHRFIPGNYMILGSQFDEGMRRIIQGLDGDEIDIDNSLNNTDMTWEAEF